MQIQNVYITDRDVMKMLAESFLSQGFKLSPYGYAAINLEQQGTENLAKEIKAKISQHVMDNGNNIQVDVRLNFIFLDRCDFIMKSRMSCSVGWNSGKPHHQ